MESFQKIIGSRLLVVLFFSLSTQVLAQEQQPAKVVKEKSMVTGKEVEWKMTGDDRVVVGDSSTHYIQIYIQNPGSVLYGNRCAEEQAAAMGLEYILIGKDIGYGMSRWEQFWQNAGAHLRAFFKNGFFWQKRLRRRIHECQFKTGDRIG